MAITSIPADSALTEKLLFEILQSGGGGGGGGVNYALEAGGFLEDSYLALREIQTSTTSIDLNVAYLPRKIQQNNGISYINGGTSFAQGTVIMANVDLSGLFSNVNASVKLKNILLAISVHSATNAYQIVIHNETISAFVLGNAVPPGFFAASSNFNKIVAFVESGALTEMGGGSIKSIDVDKVMKTNAGFLYMTIIASGAGGYTGGTNFCAKIFFEEYLNNQA